MAHEKRNIGDFVKDLKKGKYVIPHFQRAFDWDPSMAADLFKSILHNYYAGTILLWDLEDKERNLDMWDSLWGTEKAEKPTEAILDGQQRLSSIYYAIVAPKKTFPNRYSYYYFFINLDALFQGNEDESIDYYYYSKHRSIDHIKENKDKWIKEGNFPLCLLSDSDFLNSQEYQDWITEYVKLKKEEGILDRDVTSLSISEKIKSVLNYSFLTETLKNKEIQEICTIFARINSKGLNLSIFDLMNAFLFPHGIKLRKEWENLENEKLKEIDSKMKEQVLKLMSLYKQKYCSSKFLYNLIPGSKVKDRQGNEKILIKDKEEFMGLWKSSLKYSEKARKRIMNSGPNDFGAIKSKFIPNTTIIPVLGALMLHYDKELEEVSEKEFNKKIKKWYWSAVLSQDYGGSSDSIMAKDYEDMKNWLKDDSEIPLRIKNVNSSFIEDSVDLTKIKSTNNSQYSAILNLLALNNAADFFNGRSVGTYDKSKIHDHHIFPKKCGLDISETKKDCILNRTLLYDETNKKIKEKKPSFYLKTIKDKIENQDELQKIMETHLISSKALNYLQNNDFDNFIKERERTIKKELKISLGLSKEEDSISSSIIPGKEYDNENKYVSYIEDSEDFVYIIDPYFRENSLRLIRKGLKNNQGIKNIKIVTKPDSLDEDFRESFKKFSQQMKNEETDCELRALLEPKTQRKLHDRYLITKNKSFNFVSADTVSRGQMSHITEIEDMKSEFEKLWNKGKNILGNWNKIDKAKKEKEKRREHQNDK